jgi:DNA-binding NtrC family response regulator
MRSDSRWVSAIAIVVMSIVTTASVAFAQAVHGRWDIVSVQPPNVLPGGLGAEPAPGDCSPGDFSLKGIAEAAASDAERRAIHRVLQATRGNKSEAARLLRTDYKTLYLKMKQYGIDAGRFRELRAP